MADDPKAEGKRQKAESPTQKAGGLAPVRVVLDNGVTVIVKANHTTPSVSILAAVRTGGYADLPGKEGTAALCARVLDRGTVSRNAEVIADELDSRGASLSVSTGRHQMSASATCLSDDFPAVLALVADVVRHPAFPEAEVAIRRADLISSIRKEQDNPAQMAVDAFVRALYGSHPYSRKIRGTVEAVESLKRQDLVRCYQKGFLPWALTIVVVGDVDEQPAVEMASKLFGDWTALATGDKRPTGGDKPLGLSIPDAPQPLERSLVAVPMMNKSQADVAYGFVGIRRHDLDYTAISVMNNALGQYAIGGRLGDSIRERQGMAYYVFSSLEAGFGEGPLTIRAGVSAENVERTIASIDAELNAVLNDGFTEKEIDESKSYLVGSIPRQLETNGAIAAFLLNAEIFGLGLDYDVRLPGLIQAITLDDANKAARRLLDPARATIAVAGPWAPNPATLTTPTTPTNPPNPADEATPWSLPDE
ncbi:MAG: pitrilysin family protein [Acidobacteriota bacterium]|nr:pitrilysin family protein [Acidobacteriota bacterium]